MEWRIALGAALSVARRRAEKRDPESPAVAAARELLLAQHDRRAACP